MARFWNVVISHEKNSTKLSILLMRVDLKPTHPIPDQQLQNCQQVILSYLWQSGSFIGLPWSVCLNNGYFINHHTHVVIKLVDIIIISIDWFQFIPFHINWLHNIEHSWQSKFRVYIVLNTSMMSLSALQIYYSSSTSSSRKNMI